MLSQLFEVGSVGLLNPWVIQRVIVAFPFIKQVVAVYDVTGGVPVHLGEEVHLKALHG